MIDSIHFPTLNACLNGMSACLLFTGYILIRKKNILGHRIAMGSACMTSVLFLASYLYYHYHHGSTGFQGQGMVRPIYFTILISHTVLATAIVPLVVMTLFFALKENFEKHKKIAKITFPLWAYVSVTGVVIYWMLYQMTW